MKKTKSQNETKFAIFLMFHLLTDGEAAIAGRNSCSISEQICPNTWPTSILESGDGSNWCPETIFRCLKGEIRKSWRICSKFVVFSGSDPPYSAIKKSEMSYAEKSGTMTTISDESSFPAKVKSSFRKLEA